MLPLAAYCKAVRASCNTARSLALASNVCMVRSLQLCVIMHEHSQSVTALPTADFA
jgi:hypothetical protein